MLRAWDLPLGVECDWSTERKLLGQGIWDRFILGLSGPVLGGRDVH
jgi:hypothetical protein